MWILSDNFIMFCVGFQNIIIDVQRPTPSKSSLTIIFRDGIFKPPTYCKYFRRPHGINDLFVLLNITLHNVPLKFVF
jgi:hypothetical protein